MVGLGTRGTSDQEVDLSVRRNCNTAGLGTRGFQREIWGQLPFRRPVFLLQGLIHVSALGGRGGRDGRRRGLAAFLRLASCPFLIRGEPCT